MFSSMFRSKISLVLLIIQINTDLCEKFELESDFDYVYKDQDNLSKSEDKKIQRRHVLTAVTAADEYPFEHNTTSELTKTMQFTNNPKTSTEKFRINSTTTIATNQINVNVSVIGTSSFSSTTKGTLDIAATKTDFCYTTELPNNTNSTDKIRIIRQADNNDTTTANEATIETNKENSIVSATEQNSFSLMKGGTATATDYYKTTESCNHTNCTAKNRVIRRADNNTTTMAEISFRTNKENSSFSVVEENSFISTSESIVDITAIITDYYNKTESPINTNCTAKIRIIRQADNNDTTTANEATITTNEENSSFSVVEKNSFTSTSESTVDITAIKTDYYDKTDSPNHTNCTAKIRIIRQAGNNITTTPNKAYIATNKENSNVSSKQKKYLSSTTVIALDNLAIETYYNNTAELLNDTEEIRFMRQAETTDSTESTSTTIIKTINKRDSFSSTTESTVGTTTIIDTTEMDSITTNTTNTGDTDTTCLTTTNNTIRLDLLKILAMVKNLTDDYDLKFPKKLNDTLFTSWSAGTCGKTTTTSPPTSAFPHYDMQAYINKTGTLIARCYVCGLTDYKIPANSHCGDAFSTDFLPLVPVDLKSKQFIYQYKKDCRHDDNKKTYVLSDSRIMWGPWTGGCAVRWMDLSAVYTQRTCRSRKRAVMGNHYASKRMATLEMALSDVDEGCVVSPAASLVPFTRGVSLYARFYACVCKGIFCNGSHMEKTFDFNTYCTVFLILVINSLR